MELILIIIDGRTFYDNKSSLVNIFAENYYEGGISLKNKRPTCERDLVH